MRFLIKMSERIDKPALNKLFHPFPFLIIVFFYAAPILYMPGFLFCKNGNSAVPFFLRRIPIMPVPDGFKQGTIKLVRIGFYFLQTQNIRAGSFYPIDKPFADSCAN